MDSPPCWPHISERWSRSAAKVTGAALALSSLYPVIPVVLGLAVLRERLSAWQTAGLASAVGTVVLVTIG